MPRADAARRRAWLGTGAPSTLAAAAASVATLALLAACSAPAGGPGPLPDGLTVGVQQGRLDVEARRLVVHLENGGSSPVTIERVEVVLPELGAELAYADEVELTADDAIDLRLELPPPGCAEDEDGAASDTEPVVRLEGRGGSSGAAFAGERAPDDPFETLPRIVAADCLEASVAEVATITMPEHLRVEGSGAAQRAWIDVAVDPAPSGDGSLAIELVRGSTLLGNEAGTDWPLGLEIAPSDPPSVVPLAVRPARCDAHVLADDKRGTILAFVVTTGDGRSGMIDRPSSDALKAELYDYVTERCELQ
ncbi:hypothetical protein ACFVAJ_20535 [Agromyces sp. NPDC057679]|uniref:hypothetical protein n=1 Tax=Agromyces sp. NPDC057679 TaxID=3346207 RepID=UPI00366EF1B3